MAQQLDTESPVLRIIKRVDQFKLRYRCVLCGEDYEVETPSYLREPGYLVADADPLKAIYGSGGIDKAIHIHADGSAGIADLVGIVNRS